MTDRQRDILAALAERPLFAADLSERLHMPEGAVRRNIGSLREQGQPITTRPQGYALPTTPGTFIAPPPSTLEMNHTRQASDILMPASTAL